MTSFIFIPEDDDTPHQLPLQTVSHDDDPNPSASPPNLSPKEIQEILCLVTRQLEQNGSIFPARFTVQQLSRYFGLFV
jgi:hypothetical protein